MAQKEFGLPFCVTFAKNLSNRYSTTLSRDLEFRYPGSLRRWRVSELFWLGSK